MEAKIIVLDDDPTGNQTVHGCPLLLRWSPEILEKGLDDSSPLLFILSNTRALEPAAAAEVTRDICRNLKPLLAQRKQPALFVSRSDSTLRGHYPVETDVMAEELGPFDAHFLVPAFFEGGRVTIDGVHYLKEGERLVRTDETEFARDSVFGYSTSYLPDYVDEKTGGRISATEVMRLPILRSADEYYDRIAPLEGNRCVAVDATGYDELRLFAGAARRAAAAGKRFLFRSAASILSALAALSPQPIPGEEMGRLRRSSGPGAVIVGSHVKRTSEQLEALLADPRVEGLDLDVDLLPEGREKCVESLSAGIRSANREGKAAAVYTSRKERSFATKEERLVFGATVSQTLTEIVKRLPVSTSFLITKGGITSNDVLSDGLELAMCRVVGQIIPGCTVVTTPPDHRLAGLPVVIFPGNVGGPGALEEVFDRLERGRSQGPTVPPAREEER